MGFKELSTFVGFILAIANFEAKAHQADVPCKPAYEQLLTTQYIDTLELSPNNKHLLIVYSVPQISSSKGELTSQWVFHPIIKNDYQSKKASMLELPVQEDFFSPNWTPGSNLVSYLKKGNKYLSLWITPHTKFGPKKMLELDNDIISYKWSPDGKKLAVLVKKPFPQNPRKEIYELDKPEIHKLFVMDVNKDLKISNKVLLIPEVSILRIKDSHAHSLHWSPDSQGIVYAHYPLCNKEKSKFSQVALINVNTKKVRELTKGEGMHLFPSVSPNGKFVAYVTNDLPENDKNPIRFYGMDASRVCVLDLKTEKRTCLFPTPNENPFLIGWKKDGKSLFVVDQEGTSDYIYELSLDGKSISKFTQEEQSLGAVSISPSNEHISYSFEDLKTPPNGYITPIIKPEKVTPSISRSKPEIIVEKIRWPSRDKQFNLEGTFISLKSSQHGKPLPLITILQDYSNPSPSLNYVGNFSSQPIYFLGLLEKGYGIFIPSRRGGNGYGVKFRQAIYKDLGGEDFYDVMEGVDTLIAKKKADPQKLALWGWGYGGYLASWALTQTDRFRTVIVGAGMPDLVSYVGTTNEPDFLEAIMGGPFWKNWKLWRERSPISHVLNMKTPTLLQYGSTDQEVLPSQGEALYFPLRSRRIPVHMITYRDQGHKFSSPHITLMAIQDLEEWLEQYLEPNSSSQDKK